MAHIYPEELFYTKNDEWVRVEADIATIGISDYAQDQLGDIVYIEEVQIGKMVKQGEVLTNIESVKAASDIYVPVSGEIIEFNSKIKEKPEIFNKTPYTDAWICKIKISNKEELNNLMKASDYKNYRGE